MIRQITGILLCLEQKKKDYFVLLELNGIVYELLIPSSLANKLSPIGQFHKELKDRSPVTFHTIHYFEGSMGGGPFIPRLIGFIDPQERDFFELFSSVSGIGVKTALKAMAAPIQDIAGAIERDDYKWLDELPEIGTATAKKITAELKGKMRRFTLLSSNEEFHSHDVISEGPVDIHEEALLVLLQLQYSKQEAESRINRALTRNKSIHTSEELIAEIFKHQG